MAPACCESSNYSSPVLGGRVTGFSQELFAIIKEGALRQPERNTQARKKGIPDSKDDLASRDKTFSPDGQWAGSAGTNASYVTRTGF